jgi:hypothetical protein
MRLYLFGLLSLGLAGPAFANDGAPSAPASMPPSAPAPRPAPDVARFGAMLSNPLVQEAVAATVDQYADALMQTHVGPLAKLTDPRDHVRPQDTLGDLAARDHPHYRQDIHDQTRSTVAAVGQTARDMAALNTEIRRTTARLRAVLAQTKTEVDALQSAGH